MYLREVFKAQINGRLYHVHDGKLRIRELSAVAKLTRRSVQPQTECRQGYLRKSTWQFKSHLEMQRTEDSKGILEENWRTYMIKYQDL